MQRRRLLALLAGAGTVGLAGCNRPDTAGTLTATDPGTGTAGSTPTGSAESGVYVQPFVEEMGRLGTATAGPYRVALFYTVPHRFWTVTNGERSAVPKGESDGYRAHLMATVWDAETGTVIPEAGLSLELERGGRLVSEEVIYPMLSQRMGVHYGGNITLPADGDYRARVEVGALSIRRTGAFRDRLGESVSVEIPFRFTAADARRVGTRDVPEAGDAGAVAPMDADFPLGRAPDPDALPGTHLGTARSGDAVFEIVRLADPPAGVDGSGPYLAVSARTPYNGFVLPATGLSAAVGEFDGDLVRTLSPDLGYHYGASVPALADADRVRLTVETPPQIGRHEGYERAFLTMPPTELSI